MEQKEGITREMNAGTNGTKEGITRGMNTWMNGTKEGITREMNAGTGQQVKKQNECQRKNESQEAANAAHGHGRSPAQHCRHGRAHDSQEVQRPRGAHTSCTTIADAARNQDNDAEEEGEEGEEEEEKMTKSTNTHGLHAVKRTQQSRPDTREAQTSAVSFQGTPDGHDSHYQGEKERKKERKHDVRSKIINCIRLFGRRAARWAPGEQVPHGCVQRGGGGTRHGQCRAKGARPGGPADGGPWLLTRCR